MEAHVDDGRGDGGREESRCVVDDGRAVEIVEDDGAGSRARARRVPGGQTQTRVVEAFAGEVEMRDAEDPELALARDAPLALRRRLRVVRVTRVEALAPPGPVVAGDAFQVAEGDLDLDERAPDASRAADRREERCLVAARDLGGTRGGSRSLPLFSSGERSTTPQENSIHPWRELDFKMSSLSHSIYRGAPTSFEGVDTLADSREITGEPLERKTRHTRPGPAPRAT